MNSCQAPLFSTILEKARDAAFLFLAFRTTLAHTNQGLLMGEADPIPEALYDVLHSPSLFGKILLIAAFRTTATDQYDAGHASRFHTPEIEYALRRLHREIFTSWLSLSLQRQKADISIYLN